MSKIFERLVHHHLLMHCKEEQIIPNEQTGCQGGVACEHHLAKLQEYTTQQMSHNKATAFISLDCSQAFDCVSHQLLLHRFEEYRFPATLCKLIRCYLSRTFVLLSRTGSIAPRTYHLRCTTGICARTTAIYHVHITCSSNQAPEGNRRSLC